MLVAARRAWSPPLGTRPSEYVAERVLARGVAASPAPRTPREARRVGAAFVVASADADLRRQLVRLFEKAGPGVEETDDVVGAELAALREERRRARRRRGRGRTA